MAQHDEATVEAVARAIRNTSEESIYAAGTEWQRLLEERQARQAIEALTGMGWRPPLTEQERECLRDVLDNAIERGARSGQDAAATIRLRRMEEIRAMLTGGRAE